MKKNSSFFILGVILLNFISVTDIYACYAVIAGKKATKDGSVLIAHAEQNGPPAYLNFMVVPRFKFEPGSFVKFAKGGLYPQPAESYSYLWSEIYGLGGSDGIMNEWGVICVSDATRTIDHTVKEMTRLGEIKEGGVTLEIRLEIARRAKTARQAIHIAADLLNKFGYGGGGGTHVIADPNEAWLLCCMAGKKWIAARVPDDKVVILPNVNVIREVNLNDTLNFLASPDIIEFAVKKGWYDPKSGKPFDFKKAYDKKTESPFTDKYNCDARQWRGQCLVTEKYIELPVNSDGLPFAVTPARKLTVMDMKRILSDHLEGTEFDLSNKLYENKNNLLPQTTICNAPKTLDNSFSDTLYKYINGSPHNLMNSIEGMICDKTHQEGAVFQLRNWLPAEIGCIYWRTTAAPCSSVLTPWYLGINQTPDAYRKNYKIEDNVKYDFHFNPPLGTFDYDPDKAFWIFNEVEVLTDINYGKLIRKVRPVYNNLENKIISSQQDVEKKALDLYKTDKAQARKFLTEYSADVAQQAISLAKNLIKELKTETMGF